MNFLEKLDALMSASGINKSKLSQLSGVPYTTIDGFYKKGYENAKISTIRKIAHTLNTSLDYLIEETPNQKTLSPEASEIAAAYDRADEKSRKMARLALEDFMETSVPVMVVRRTERTAADNNPDAETWHIRDTNWRETLSRWMIKHPNASVVSGGVPEWVEFNLIRAVYEEGLPGWSKEELRERAERMFRRPWTGKAEILFPSELALFRIDSEAAERRRKSGKDYSRFNESKTINLSCFRCPMVILCNQRREKAPFTELKRRAPSIYAADPDMAHIFNDEECPVYSLLKFSHPEISEWEIPKFSVDENGNFRLPAGNSAPFAIFSMINPVFQAELDQALKPVGNDADDLGKT